jgi:hypothetical protein
MEKDIILKIVQNSGKPGVGTFSHGGGYLWRLTYWGFWEWEPMGKYQRVKTYSISFSNQTIL